MSGMTKRSKTLSQVTFTVRDDIYAWLKKKPRGWLHMKLAEIKGLEEKCKK